MAHFRDFSMFACPATDDFLRPRIDHMIDLRHPLAVLASRMSWQEIEARGAQVLCGKGRSGVPYYEPRQCKRMKRAIKRQRTIVGRLQRELNRKACAIGAAVREALGETWNKAQRFVVQSGQRQAVEGQPKLYAWHAPEVDCISKGKAKTAQRSEITSAVLAGVCHGAAPEDCKVVDLSTPVPRTSGAGLLLTHWPVEFE